MATFCVSKGSAGKRGAPPVYWTLCCFSINGRDAEILLKKSVFFIFWARKKRQFIDHLDTQQDSMRVS